MVKTTHVLSYLDESSYGVPATNPIVAATQTYLFGEFYENQELASPIPEIKPAYPQNSRDPSVIDVGPFALRKSLKFYMMNGIWLWYALGQNAAGGAAGHYIHTLTGCWAAGLNKFDLPSFTIHHEEKNGTSKASEYYGCKIDTLTIEGKRNQALTCQIDYIASKVATGRNVLTTAPYLPQTPAATPYIFGKTELNWNAEGVSTEVQSLTFKIHNYLTPVPVHRVTDEHFAKYLREGDRSYELALTLVQSADDSNKWLDLLIAHLQTEDLTLAFPRGTDDLITMTLSNNTVTLAQKIFKVKAGEYAVNLTIIPAICSVVVDDNIAPGTVHYKVQV